MKIREFIDAEFDVNCNIAIEAERFIEDEYGFVIVPVKKGYRSDIVGFVPDSILNQDINYVTMDGCYLVIRYYGWIGDGVGTKCYEEN